mmetsp:Transcript_26077/g.44476  ORF Transcript_26077/g.44476 Transcript_26077/m.44476 type:complete len:181 (-) Transcript_26077:72-614(-)
MSSPNRRRELDVWKLMTHDYTVDMGDDGGAFTVLFKGPKDTYYEGGIWNVRVELPQGYPYKSPSIGFTNKIYHPNVDEGSGSVCLDVINQTWTPMYDLINIFETFLPQLLHYPNPTDPLNGEAASLLLKDPEQYSTKVKEYVRKYASSETPVFSDSESSSEIMEDDDDIMEEDDEDDFFR